jgi:hypothetical protein
MLAVKGIYDGKKVEIIEKVNIPEGKLQEVIVTFLSEVVHLEPFDPDARDFTSFNLHEFINDWSSEEIEAIEQIYNARESFFDGRKFDL